MTNPDTRPLPHGWITRFDANHNAWFYVNTKANPPVTTWVHPLGAPRPSAPAMYRPPQGGPPPQNGGHGFHTARQPGNPYPPQQQGGYSRVYVNTKANPPVKTWVHPLGAPRPPGVPTMHRPPQGGPPPQNGGYRFHTAQQPGSPYPPQQQGSYSRVYVNTTANPPVTTWVHPLGAPHSPGAPAMYSPPPQNGGYGFHTARQPGSPYPPQQQGGYPPPQQYGNPPQAQGGFMLRSAVSTSTEATFGAAFSSNDGGDDGGFGGGDDGGFGGDDGGFGGDDGGFGGDDGGFFGGDDGGADVDMYN
ncbi:WW domain-containing protein [Mycena sanguinolenta]|uniref:WW domain-containing protein n=1 Tax=Mycena sanguinolenta TaxID=230812 RepID=A0A8H6YAI5_9AGAR|nr:WW domain-containing protein [Mycena sanguinolenta]